MMDMESLLIENLCKYKRLNERKLEAIAEKWDLRKIDMDIIIFLSGSKEKDTAKDIAGTERFTKGHISQSVKRLNERGFIVSIQDKKDLRVQHLRLQEPAKKVLCEIMEIKNNINSCVFKGITEEENTVLKNVYMKMYNNIVEEMSK